MNRLVTSACETFVSATLKDGGRETTPSPEEAPPSPHSSHSGSSLNGMVSHWNEKMMCIFVCLAELNGVAEAEVDLNTLVDTVKRHAQIASRAYAKRKTFQKSLTHPHSRSYGNLMDLDEGVEDEMSRKDKLKFPSDCAVDSPYYQMLENKEDAMRALRGLIRAGKEAGGAGGKGGGAKSELESSLSEPDLHKGRLEEIYWLGQLDLAFVCTDDFSEDEDTSRPFSSSAVLQASRLRTLLDGGVAKFRADSGSSSGMILRVYAALGFVSATNFVVCGVFFFVALSCCLLFSFVLPLFVVQSCFALVVYCSVLFALVVCCSVLFCPCCLWFSVLFCPSGFYCLALVLSSIV